MGGEIMIIDKEYGEKGTCFRFNAFFHARESNNSNVVQEDIWFHKDQVANDIPYRAKGLMLKKDFQLDRLQAVILVQGKEGSLILQRWMECHGIKVWPINQWDQLYPTLEKVKHKMFISHSSTSRKFDSTSFQSNLGDTVSHYSNESEKDDKALSSVVSVRDLNKKTSRTGETNCVLIIVDMSCGHFSETCSTLAHLGKNTADLLYKVVWIIDPKVSHGDLRRLENKQVPCDLILQKPFYRSQILSFMQLFQKNGDIMEGQSDEIKEENMMPSAHGSIKLSPSNELDQQTTRVSTTSRSSYLTRQRVGLEYDLSNDKPLSGMNILVAEDNIVLRRLAMTTLSRLGATVECCGNGEDALNLVRKALQGFNGRRIRSHFNLEAQGLSKMFSYDIVLMDCEVIFLTYSVY